MLDPTLARDLAECCDEFHGRLRRLAESELAAPLARLQEVAALLPHSSPAEADQALDDAVRRLIAALDAQRAWVSDPQQRQGRPESPAIANTVAHIDAERLLAELKRRLDSPPDKQGEKAHRS